MDSFSTPATNGMTATIRSMATHDTPLRSRFGGNSLANFPGALMTPSMVDGAFQGGMGDGTIHVACITQAGPEMLLRSQNAAYIAATHQIESLSQQIQHLEGQVVGQKQALAEALSKVPLLLGITGTEDATDNKITSGKSHCACTGKAVLGLGLKYPVAPTSRPPTFTYWTREDQQGRPAKGGKRGGQHKNDENVGQIWIEDEHGHIIEGYVAAQIREMLTACFHSLIWSGQATYHSRELPHEARVFIHTTLAEHFPFLLICQGGQWKINELIIQNYSSFAKTHLCKDGSRKQKSTKKSTGKRRRADSTSGDSVEIDALPPAKAPRYSEDPSHAPPVLPPTSTSSPSNAPSHPLLEPGNDLYVLDNTPPSPRTQAPSLLPAPLLGHLATAPLMTSVPLSPSPSRPSTPFTFPTDPHVHADQEIVGGHHEACSMVASPQVPPNESSVPSAADMPDMSTANCRAPSVSVTNALGLPQIPIPKPFPVKVRSAQHPDTPSSSIPTVTESSSPPPSSSPVGAPASPAPLCQDQSPSDQAVDANPADAVAPLLSGNGSAVSAAIVPTSRRRGQPPAKASSKYKPETISMQSFHMRDRIQENPDITFNECQELYKKLSPEQLQAYQDEVGIAKKERNGLKKKTA